MSLGVKQLIPDPWAEIDKKYPVGSKHSGVVRNFTNFGVFVELEEGVDGLIHISDLSWSKKIKHPSEFTKIGDSIEAVVLELDLDNRRLSLGHKQVEENPWDVFESIFTEGSIHEGTITAVNDKGAVVNLPYGVEGFAPTKHLEKENGGSAALEETLNFKVIEFNKENKKIIVSHARIHEDVASDKKAEENAEKQAKQKAEKKDVKKLKDSMEKTTLGDINVLANLKESMEENEKNAKKK